MPIAILVAIIILGSQCAGYPYGYIAYDDEVVSRDVAYGWSSEEPVFQKIKVKRVTTAKAKNLEIAYTHSLINTKNHRLVGTTFTSKDFASDVLLVTGGTFDYTHTPTGSEVTLAAQKSIGSGFDLNAKGQYNFYRTTDGKISAGVGAEYDGHFGYSVKSTKPSYNAFFTLKHNFV